MFKNLFAPNIAKLEEKKDKEGLKSALDHKDFSIRLSALQALCRLGDIQSVYTVYKQSPDEKLRASALNMLQNLTSAQIGSIVSSLINSTAKTQNPMDKDLAAIIGAPMVPIILQRYYETIKHNSVYWLAGVIAAVGTPAIAPLISACEETLAGRNKSWATHMIEALGRFRHPQSRDYLLSLLDRPLDASTFEQVIISLGEARESRAVEPLIQILANQSLKGGPRGRAAIALGEIGDEKAIEPLIIALQDSDEYVRKFVAHGLSKIKNADFQSLANQYVLQLSNPDLKTKVNAIQILGNLKFAATFEPLAGLLSDPEDVVCEASALALASIDPSRARQVVDQFCKQGHRFGPDRRGSSLNEVIRRCIRCGYEQKDVRRCPHCGHTQFTVFRDDWNERYYARCDNCLQEVP